MQVATTTFIFDLQRFDTVTVSSAEEFTTAISGSDATANDGDTIQLNGDFSLTEMVEIKKANLTLDLNGHTITGSGSFTNNPLFRVESGSFTVNDSSTDGNGKITSSAPLGNIQFGASDATLNIQGGTIENTYANGYGISIHEGNLSISGGTIVNSNSGYAVFTHTNTNNITISGGTISSGSEGIDNRVSSSILIEGTASIYGGKKGIKNVENSASKITINGGTITGGENVTGAAIQNDSNDVEILISGGTLNGKTMVLTTVIMVPKPRSQSLEAQFQAIMAFQPPTTHS